MAHTFVLWYSFVKRWQLKWNGVGIKEQVEEDGMVSDPE